MFVCTAALQTPQELKMKGKVKTQVAHHFSQTACVKNPTSTQFRTGNLTYYSL